MPLAAMLHPGGTVSTRPTGRSERVVLPPLQAGRHMLERMPVTEEPEGASWRDPAYLSVNPFVAEFADVTLHGPAGIVSGPAGVVAETLLQTDEAAGYCRHGDRIALAAPAGPASRLPGRTLSLLGGNAGNLYHWLLDCIGRLAAAEPGCLDACHTVLLPPLSAQFQAATLTLLGLDRRWTVHTVRPGEAVWVVERLVLPWTMLGHHYPHPALRPFFAPLRQAALAAAPIWAGGAWPRRLYVDRRGSAQRRLLDEAALVDGLATRGFVPVRLETLPLATQVALFARAEAIVAPHGAGLTHLLHAAPGCNVLELHMDTWVSWCFRRLAALGGLRYDCVIGRQQQGTSPDWVHASAWSLSVTHVLAAVDRMLA